MRQASRLQRKIEETRLAVRDQTVEATGAGDKVKVTANYAREIVRIDIDPEFLAADRDFTLDAAVGACNNALKAASVAMDAEIEKATGGLKIPGIT